MARSLVNTPTDSPLPPKQKKWLRYLPLYLMALPGMAYFLINNYIPMSGLVLAFKSWDASLGVFGSPWVGFDNFAFLFGGEDAWIISRNTILYNSLFIVLNLVLGVFLAILLTAVKSRFFMRAYQTVFLIPMLVSMVVVSYLAMAFLNPTSGLINKVILPLFNMEPISWYSEPDAWIWILPIVNLWKNLGFGVVLYFSYLISIDKDLYEAASIDGAGFFLQTQHVTLPLLVPAMVMTTLLGIGRIFYSDFGLFYQVPLNSGVILDTTNVLDTFVYRGLMQLGDIGMATAAGLYQSVVGFILILSANWAVKRVSSENALF